MDLTPWNYTVINATGATVIAKTGHVVYGGYRILAAAGAHTMDIYDNGAASGQKFASGISVNGAANAEETVGFQCKNGLTVNMSGDPTDGLILVRWR